MVDSVRLSEQKEKETADAILPDPPPNMRSTASSKRQAVEVTFGRMNQTSVKISKVASTVEQYSRYLQ
jgi:hypothetical protein